MVYGAWFAWLLVLVLLLYLMLIVNSVVLW